MAIQTPTENWFKFPNHIADNLADYDPYELKILVFMLRRTVGMLNLTNAPDQRFSISFLAKNCKISESQASKSKKSLLAKDAIKEDGTAGDGTKLYSVVWSSPIDIPHSNRHTPSPQCGDTPLLNAGTDKDISLKTVEKKTLDASASSAAQLICDKDFIDAVNKGEITVNRIQIPYKEISDYFLKKHREFRKVKDEKYMPKWGPKETKAVKRLIETMNEANFSKPEYRELTSDRIMRSFQFMTEAFLLYLKDCKDSNYAKTTPILPSQLTEKVFNRILPYIQKLETVPKLEIKTYENKGIAIGPMPEGW